MNKDAIIAGLAGLVIGILIAPSVTSVMPMAWENRMSGNRMMNQIDAHFIEQMIPHHEDAIAMATVAQARGEHPEIKSLGANIIGAQTDEIEQMKEWYTEWFNKIVPDANSSMGSGHGMNMMMHGGMMGDTSDLQSLETAKPFDKAFIDEMIPHHQMAVMMAQMLLNSTNRSEMKQLAEDIISAQTKEIDQMRAWYRSWYSQ